LAFKKQILLFLKGVALGVADVIPRFSSGTVAFIMGLTRLFDVKDKAVV
jgi:uncharacterized membrane protein